MSDSYVILCPGQGAQRVGMGRGWFDHSPRASQTFASADAILGDRYGAPLSEICFEGPAETLNRTDVAQPALFVTGVACFQAWLGESEGAPLEATAGLSLGEYTALHLAGALTFEEALELVALRGRAMQDAAGATPSGMVALTGADEAKAEEVRQAALAGGDPDDLVIANLNSPIQTVLSGRAAACDRAVEAAGELGVRATPLPVAGAFHSPLMAPAADRLAAALEQASLGAPACPVLSNVSGAPHEGDSPDAIRRALVEQLTRPVRWVECCQWLVRNAGGAYHELAPGTVLAGLMKRIDRSCKVQSHDEPKG